MRGVRIKVTGYDNSPTHSTVHHCAGLDLRQKPIEFDWILGGSRVAVVESRMRLHSRCHETDVCLCIEDR